MVYPQKRITYEELVPYAIGLFTTLPLLLWLLMWGFLFPGPKSGFDSALSVALIVTSIPLVIWFFCCSLGLIANSVAGSDELERPTLRLVRTVITVLPPAAVTLGVGGGAVMVNGGEGSLVSAAPVLLGWVIAMAIARGEQGRERDRQRRRRVERPLTTAAVVPSDPPGSGVFGARLLAWFGGVLAACLLAAVLWTS